jgi:methyltransferase-like protein/2-polyprenyl-3-methyl-5-hydroxy-6-metoxy-1,4-benzoquinol methylase
VLELGCGTGWNLFPMADRYPHATFVGVDGAGPQIAAAREAADGVGLKNLEFYEMSLAEAGQQLGTFDYIICHDVLSRATEKDQDQLLALCCSRLAPRGVAYVGFRALPGCLIGNVVRELIRDCVEKREPIDQQIRQARKVLQLVSESLSEDRSAYAGMLKSEADRGLALGDAALVYEHLGPEYQPLYFHAFIDRVTRQQLQYLGDSEIATMFPAALGDSIQRNLAQVSQDFVELEQHMDFLRNRRFHHSLLCHRGLSVSRQLSPTSLHGLFLAGNLRPDGGPTELRSPQAASYLTGKGLVVTASLPSLKAALDELARAWPRAIAFGELVETVESRLAAKGAGHATFSAQQHDELARNLVNCLISGSIEVRTAPDDFVTAVGERPRARRWTRAEAESLPYVTNHCHVPVVLDDVSRNLLCYLDGRHDRAGLHGMLVKAVDQGRLSILKSGIPASQGGSAEAILEQVLDQSLARLAASALLVA